MKNFLRENKIMIVWFLSSLLNGILLRKISSGDVLIRPLLGDILFLLIIAGFGFLIKRKKIYYLFWTIISVSICYINSVYFNQYQDYASIILLETLLQSIMMPIGAVTDVIEISDYIYLWQIILFIVVLFWQENKNKNTLYFKKTIISAFVLFVLIVLSCDGEDIYRIKNNWNKEYFVRNFGVYTYQVKDIISTAKDLVWVSGKDKARLEILEYFKDKETKPNEYTDIFKGKNLLLIHAESIQSMFIDEKINGQEILPNLSRLKKEGMYFSNFYSQESIGTSSDTEFTLNTSVLPIGKGTVFINYDKNDYVAIPNILTEMGYTTFSMHGNYCRFWNRNKIYQKLGYQRFYCENDYIVNEKIGIGISDKDFFKQSVEYLKDIDGPFFGPLIMLSNHTPFEITEEMAKFEVGNLTGTKVGRYLQTLHYADEAIGELINDLDNNGLLENTVIVIYGDHDSKLKEKEYQSYFGNSEKIDFYEYESYTKVPLIIWTKDNSINGEVDKVMGMIDVLPTLGNMFGFRSKYSLGNDIFSVDENIVVFPNGNFITDKVYVNNQKETKYEFEPVSDEYIKENEKKARKIVEISNNLIKYDLFE